MDPRWRALLVLTAARCSLGFQFQSVASVSPMLVEEMGLSGADLGALIGLYFLPGLVLATGHHRNGVLLAPLTGRVVADVLAGDDLAGPAAAFAGDRFSARTALETA